jgi:hypothetical protein
MDVADSTVNAFSGHDWSTAVNDDFLSFSDDVSKRAALFGDDTGPADDGRVGELFMWQVRLNRIVSQWLVLQLLPQWNTWYMETMHGPRNRLQQMLQTQTVSE